MSEAHDAPSESESAAAGPHPPAGRETIAADRPPDEPPGKKPRRPSRRPVLRFVVGLAILVGGFNAAFILWYSKGEQFAAYMNLNADVSAAIIRAAGDGAEANGTEIVGERYTINLKRGCDALQAAAFYVFAVLTSPVGLVLRRRLVAVAVGAVLLLVINLVRIISLYYTGVFFPTWFDVMHVDVWQAVFVFLPIVFWLIWLFRAMRHSTRPHAPS